jgi:hypothetical protein
LLDLDFFYDFSIYLIYQAFSHIFFKQKKAKSNVKEALRNISFHRLDFLKSTLVLTQIVRKTGRNTFKRSSDGPLHLQQFPFSSLGFVLSKTPNRTLLLSLSSVTWHLNYKEGGVKKVTIFTKNPRQRHLFLWSSHSCNNIYQSIFRRFRPLSPC